MANSKQAITNLANAIEIAEHGGRDPLADHVAEDLDALARGADGHHVHAGFHACAHVEGDWV